MEINTYTFTWFIHVHSFDYCQISISKLRRIKLLTLTLKFKVIHFFFIALPSTNHRYTSFNVKLYWLEKKLLFYAFSLFAVSTSGWCVSNGVATPHRRLAVHPFSLPRTFAGSMKKKTKNKRRGGFPALWRSFDARSTHKIKR